jgi:hypothetical protein
LTLSKQFWRPGIHIITALQDFLKSFQELFHASVKYLAPETKDYHVTRVVDAVMEHKETHGVDKFLYLDPQFPAKSAPRKKAAFKEAIVFMIGGGNYVEYQNIQDYAKKVHLPSQSKQIRARLLFVCNAESIDMKKIASK